MSAMHFLHYCLIVLLCSLSVALCWPFKHRTGQKKLRMYERDPDFIGSTTNLLVKLQPHNPSRRKQGHHTSSYTSMFDNTGPIEVFRPRKSPCEQEDGTKLIQCKSNKSQCIHEYMICDDHKNCDGGEDEDPGSCLLRVWILKWMKRIEKSIKQ
ncbi:uncharacterized protein LOC124281763 isoform X2 [Haliotis rubra]|uniref:uncharacterized protein LOC124281763 isoform X2 n=1 Tax=Haliotis rubra TaxID=36100 RepID=UPI001EE54A33|nr:uncharacterized protein LOC124281763 isoform X2 [Haliotis rubra]